MADTSVIECIQDEPGVITAHTSWLLQSAIFRQGVDQTIIKLVESRFIDGRIYCLIQRETVSIVSDQIFDLETDKHHLLLASGTALRNDSVGPHHDNRGVTQEKISLVNPTPPETTQTPPELPPNEEIYEGCGTEKLCFGFPGGCISTQNCHLLTTIMRVNMDIYEFEMLSLRKNFFV